MLGVAIDSTTAPSELSRAGIGSVATETPDFITSLLWTLQRANLAATAASHPRQADQPGGNRPKLESDMAKTGHLTRGIFGTRYS